MFPGDSFVGVVELGVELLLFDSTLSDELLYVQQLINKYTPDTHLYYILLQYTIFNVATWNTQNIIVLFLYTVHKY